MLRPSVTAISSTPGPPLITGQSSTRTVVAGRIISSPMTTLLTTEKIAVLMARPPHAL
jgi:hypothetical protein